MNNSFYQLLWFFTIYAVLGWCAEVAFATLKTGKFVNRGFLSGPVCPIYGFGVSLVVLLLTPLKGNFLLLFLGSVLLTSALEYLTGLVLEKVFDDKWWDYSSEPFNIKGYVCLRFSILWGLACVLIVDRIHPYILRFVDWIPHTLGLVLLVVVMVLFIADAGVTIDSMLKLKRKLKLMREVAAKLRELSDDMGQNIAGSVANVVKVGETAKNDFAEYRANVDHLRAELKLVRTFKKAELEHKFDQSAAELRTKYEALMHKHSFTHKRLLKAFPNLQKGSNQEIIEKWKEYWQNK